MYYIQHEVLIISLSPPIDMNEKQCKVRDYLNLTALANHYNWQIKNNHFLPILLEYGLYCRHVYRPNLTLVLLERS